MHHCTNHTENIGQIMTLKPIRKFGFRFWLVRLIALLLPETSIREDYIWMMHIRYHVWVSGVFKYTRILKSGRDLWQFHVPFETHQSDLICAWLDSIHFPIYSFWTSLPLENKTILFTLLFYTCRTCACRDAAQHYAALVCQTSVECECVFVYMWRSWFPGIRICWLCTDDSISEDR